VLFGSDIIINNQPIQNQRQVTICSAFNGWLFAEYMYNDIYNNAAVAVLKSIDNGLTWTPFINGVFPGSRSFNSLELIATGDSISNLKLFLAFLPTSAPKPQTTYSTAYVWRYNGVTGAFEDGIFEDTPVSSIALCDDFNYPANGSGPYSIGVLYSKKCGNIDSLIFRSSGNGGVSLDYMQGIASQGERFHQVALTYGRSPSRPNGRYFAGWIAKPALTASTGNFLTAHTNPDFNSPFTNPVNLSSINPSYINVCRNPAISCQVSNIDNDSSNITEIILFDKYDASNQRYDVKGFYNLQAANYSNFKPINFTDSLSNNVKPSVNFNSFESKFMVTYFDSTNLKLPFLLNNFNLESPDSWEVITPGYNDIVNLSEPGPKVVLNVGQQQGTVVWCSIGTDGNGVATLDAEYLYTGLPSITRFGISKLFTVYPVPCTTSLTISFLLQKTEKVTIILYHINGKVASTIANDVFKTGINTVEVNTASHVAASYFVTFRTAHDFGVSKVIVTK